MIEFDEHRLVWVQVYEELRRRIETGAYQVNNPIPSLMHLVQEFGVARGTVRKVIAVLAREGYLNPIPGKGTYVRPRNEWGRGGEAQPGRENPES